MLEDIYESQLYKNPKTDIDERLRRIYTTMGAVTYAFMTAKLRYDQEPNDFYKHDLQKLKEMESQFLDLREQFENRFITHPFTNHPNPDTRKDIHG